MEFFIKCNPPKATAQGSSRVLKNPKTGNYFIGKSKNSKASIAKADLIALLREYAPEKPMVGAVQIGVVWVYPWRKSEPKKNRSHGFKWCDKKPDSDNLRKLLFDAMTLLGFWIDDSQIADDRFLKVWGDNPGIQIKLRELSDGEF